ncbi:MAG: glycosyltransferase family 9 protein [Verrucomicrobiae bacterium]|nr:glycosyltransferase family 9 protein [Verrucomicrobiae bacterium]
MGVLREERRAAGRIIMRLARRCREALRRSRPLPNPATLPRRILILRPYFLGDIVLCLPLAQALKQAQPDARISWLCRNEWAPLLRGHAAVDEVISWPERSAGEWRRFLMGLRGRFDLVLALAWDRATPWIALATGASFRLGIEEFGRPRLSALLHTHTVIATERRADRRPMADFYFEPLRRMGFGPRADDPHLAPTAEEDREVGERLAAGLGICEGFLLVHPGGRLKNKRWMSERFAEVLRGLGSSGEQRVVLVCGPGEEAWAADLARDLPPGRGMFWPSPKLGELIALSKRARLFLGNDSGPMHVAAATGCRVVAIFGGDSRRWGPCGAGHRVIAGKGGIESVSVEEVRSVFLHGNTPPVSECSPFSRPR